MLIAGWRPIERYTDEQLWRREYSFAYASA